MDISRDRLRGARDVHTNKVATRNAIVADLTEHGLIHLSSFTCSSSSSSASL
jgi:hypothetical protein